MGRRISEFLGGHARRMRMEPTEPEKRLWRHLSNSQLAGFKFRRQTVIDGRICDFSCPTVGLVVEVDGDTHDRLMDMQRDNALAQSGYFTLRFSNDEVMTNMSGVLEAILDQCRQLPARRYKPTPTPPLEGRG